MTPFERAVRAVRDCMNPSELSDGTLLVEDKFNDADFAMIAKAAIEAIREPNDEMVRAAVLSTIEIWDEDRDSEREFRTEFTAAIDVILTKEPSSE